MAHPLWHGVRCALWSFLSLLSGCSASVDALIRRVGFQRPRAAPAPARVIVEPNWSGHYSASGPD